MDGQEAVTQATGSSVIDASHSPTAACFEYGEVETTYLAHKDARLGEVIQTIGHVCRALDPDLFSATAHHIIGQQVSLEAQRTVWNRMQQLLGQVAPETVASLQVVD